MMLSPETRSLYTDALTPPAGYQLDMAIAATFSLDLNTLLSVPLQLVLHATENRDELMRDQLALHEALQRSAAKVHVFTQYGRISAPNGEHLLYSLLEPVITEVRAPNKGAFHPKIWLLRFVDETRKNTAYRLMLPSKNLTADRSWDAALTLDGTIGENTNANGDVLADFVSRLPGLAVASYTPSQDFHDFAAELRYVNWDLPEGFDELSFHILGLGGSGWMPAKSDKLLIISPFVTKEALKSLAKTSADPVALISRSESLADLSGEIPFTSPYVLHECAESDDSDDGILDSNEIGLHAKVYLFESNGRTHIALGSANATNAALVNRNNVEIVAELAGSFHKVGRIRHFLDPDNAAGLGKYLWHWQHSEADSPDSASEERRARLEDARDAILAVDIGLHCRADDEGWVLELGSVKAPVFPEDVQAKVRPVTIQSGDAVSLIPLLEGQDVHVRVAAIESLTSLIAFELSAGKERLSFTLNLPVTGMPEERDRAILRSIVSNRSGFLRYLLLLLAGLGDGADVATIARAFSTDSAGGQSSAFDDVPLLEELIRAFSREPDRLLKVRRLVNDICADDDADEILPDKFLGVWQVFEEALAQNEQ